MIKQNAVLRCDQCGTEVSVVLENGQLKPVKGWFAASFSPGVLNNKDPKPVRHFCSVKCKEENKEEDAK